MAKRWTLWILGALWFVPFALMAQAIVEPEPDSSFVALEDPRLSARSQLQKSLEMLLASVADKNENAIFESGRGIFESFYDTAFLKLSFSQRSHRKFLSSMAEEFEQSVESNLDAFSVKDLTVLLRALDEVVAEMARSELHKGSRLLTSFVYTSAFWGFGEGIYRPVKWYLDHRGRIRMHTTGNVHHASDVVAPAESTGVRPSRMSVSRFCQAALAGIYRVSRSTYGTARQISEGTVKNMKKGAKAGGGFLYRSGRAGAIGFLPMYWGYFKNFEPYRRSDQTTRRLRKFILEAIEKKKLKLS